MFCPSCGNQIPDNTKYCEHCGENADAAQKASTEGAAQTPPASGPQAGGWEDPAKKEEKQASSTPPQTSGPFIPRDINFDPVKWLKEAWAIIQADMGNILIFNLVYMVVVGVLCATMIGVLAVPGILAGYMIVLLAYLRKKGALDIGQMLQCGWGNFVDMLVLEIIGGVIASIAAICLVIPGVMVGLAFMMAGFLIVDKKAQFGDAMNAAFAILSKQAAGLFLFTILLIALWLIPGLLGMIPVLGYIIVFVASIFLTPLFMIAIAKAYEEMFP